MIYLLLPKILCFLTVSLAFLILGIFSYLGGTQNYGEVIQLETEEWSRGAIVDLVTQDSKTCPNGYELI